METSTTPLNACDKCRMPVAPDNNALLLDYMLPQTPESALGSIFCLPRHLFPVVVEGQIVCPGSPSRAQYLIGSPKDSSNSFDAALEPIYRAAYARLQQKWAPLKY